MGMVTLTMTVKDAVSVRVRVWVKVMGRDLYAYHFG